MTNDKVRRTGASDNDAWLSILDTMSDPEAWDALCPPERPMRAPQSRWRGTPSLRCWRAELRRGARTPTTFDALWRAACREAWARDVPALADAYRDDARRIIARASRERVA